MCPRATFPSTDECIIRTAHTTSSHRQYQLGSNQNGINELMRQQLSSQLQELVAQTEKGSVVVTTRRRRIITPNENTRRRSPSNEDVTPRQRLLDIIDEVLDLVDED